MVPHRGIGNATAVGKPVSRPVFQVLAQLEARGLITRLTDDGDRRVKPVQLTDAALPLIETVLAESCVDERAWLRERLSDAQIAEVTALLARLAED